MSDIIISVRGDHEARIAPERAIARISASVDGHDRGQVVERLAALTAPVREGLALRKDAGTIVEWSSERVAVWSDRPWNNEGRQLDLVHHASVHFSATFTDFMLLSDWLGDIAITDGLQINGVDWQLTPATRAEVERQVSTEAVLVARTRAQAYALALGHTEITALEVADIGLLAGGHESAPAPRMFAKAMMNPDTGSGVVDFQPDDIVVSAGVHARFSAR